MWILFQLAGVTEEAGILTDLRHTGWRIPRVSRKTLCQEEQLSDINEGLETCQLGIHPARIRVPKPVLLLRKTAFVFTIAVKAGSDS
ncbi:hypothetical protein V461_05865 [Pantoea ananatis BRT98]|nr:hypothetical protein V461_05865 [Pantoea ananatis BRT98]